MCNAIVITSDGHLIEQNYSAFMIEKYFECDYLYFSLQKIYVSSKTNFPYNALVSYIVGKPVYGNAIFYKVISFKEYNALFDLKNKLIENESYNPKKDEIEKKQQKIDKENYKRLLSINEYIKIYKKDIINV